MSIDPSQTSTDDLSPIAADLSQVAEVGLGAWIAGQTTENVANSPTAKYIGTAILILSIVVALWLVKKL